MLIVFDVDGTLIGGESADWAAFDAAVAAVLGFMPHPDFYNSLDEITSQSIAEAAVLASGRRHRRGAVDKVCAEYLRRLKIIHAGDENAFGARLGAKALIDELRSDPEFDVAVATGDWIGPITFKLASAGLDVADFAIATSSDCARRSDIIRLAAARTGRSLADTVYIGDGVWDLRACRELNIPFVGTGAKSHLLRDAGAKHLHPNFAIGSLRETVRIAASVPRFGETPAGV